jgi:hypothetical protein
MGSVPYIPKTLKRRGAFMQYLCAGNVIWLLKPDIEAHFAQLDRPSGDRRPEPPRRKLR